MSETDPADRYEDVRRIGLNPASDYGDGEQRADANEAIRKIKEGYGLNLNEQPSLFDDNLEVNPGALPREPEKPQQRAVLGSRAIAGASHENDLETDSTTAKPSKQSARDRELDDYALVKAREYLRRSIAERRDKSR